MITEFTFLGEPSFAKKKQKKTVLTNYIKCALLVYFKS